jgi:glycosyltransferase involved in cell wall biosynthesis
MDKSSTEKSVLVSVIVEGYNESLSGSVAGTLEALKRQNFPLDQVEVILLGSNAQAEEWKKVYTDRLPFRMKIVAAEGANYFELKNRGAEAGSGEILAFTDSDVYPEPEWLPAIVEAIRSGADISAGITLFRGRNDFGPDHPLMQVAASISYGSVIEVSLGNGLFLANGFQAHNVAFRAEFFKQNSFRPDLGRICAGILLSRKLARGSEKLIFQPEQRVAHHFTFDWWGPQFHKRSGYEILLLRRLDPNWPHKWVSKLGILEPLLIMLWHILQDLLKWFPYSKLMGIGPGRRLLLLPLLFVMSCIARGYELGGMFSTLFDRKGMRQFAETH